MLSLGRLLAVAALLFPVASVACAADTDADEGAEGTDGSEEALTNASISLKYEGTCEFLRSCSRWSRGYPKGYVLWGCSAENDEERNGTELGACEDDELWVAGPYKSNCGQTAHICKGDVCVDAKVKDISVSHSWEASNGVMAALGLPYGLSSACSGFGGGRVKITTSRK